MYVRLSVVAMNVLQIRGYRIARNMVSILTWELYVASSTLRLLDYAESFCLAERQVFHHDCANIKG